MFLDSPSYIKRSLTSSQNNGRQQPPSKIIH